MKKTIFWVVIIIIILLIISLVSGKSDDEKIKVGVLTPLSGNIAVAGEVQKNALKLAEEKVGDPNIELIFEDSAYDPKTAVDGYEALKLKGVKIMIADGSPVVASIREKAVNDGIMVFAQSATTPAFTDDSPITCRIGVTADSFGPSIANYLTNYLEAEKIAILVSNNEYGTQMKDEITKAFSGEVLVTELYDGTASDFRSNITKLIDRQNEIDALFVINNILPEPFFNQLNELGWSKPIVSDIWTITSPNMKDRTVASGISFVDYKYSPQIDLLTNQGAIEYAETFKERFDFPPILLGALTYDSYLILDEAIKEVGGDPKDVSEYLLKMPTYDGITGPIIFDSSCQNKKPEIVWRKVIEDGNFTEI